MNITPAFTPDGWLSAVTIGTWPPTTGVITVDPNGDGTIGLDVTDEDGKGIRLDLSPADFDAVIRGLLRARRLLKVDAHRRAEQAKTWPVAS